jgi:tRNA (guanine-N7-)-methyltransferase
MSPVRVRQHVNPLSRQHQSPIAAPNWKNIFANPQQPLHLDIGCARGQFLLEMAQLQPDWNFVGVEIRDPLVDFANQQRDQAQLTNLHYLSGNINVSLDGLEFPELLHCVTIQFPDPWFKQRHRKRRVVHGKFVQVLALCMQPDGWVFLQSDVLAIAEQMRDTFDSHPLFARTHPTEPWLVDNPFPVRTEREEMTLSQSKSVFRCQFRRVNPEFTAENPN